MQLLGREVGLDQPLFLIAGPCVVESEELQLRTAERLKRITDHLGVQFIFKSSFDKANRSSDKSYRGLGMDEGLRILEKVRSEAGVPVLTDVHDIPQIVPVAGGRRRAADAGFPRSPNGLHPRGRGLR
jgi:2-dehydro-3-deoxyphosphooctonate aldolase (KDO 8-P synthase)